MAKDVCAYEYYVQWQDWTWVVMCESLDTHSCVLYAQSLVHGMTKKISLPESGTDRAKCA